MSVKTQLSVIPVSYVDWLYFWSGRRYIKNVQLLRNMREVINQVISPLSNWLKHRSINVTFIHSMTISSVFSLTWIIQVCRSTHADYLCSSLGSTILDLALLDFFIYLSFIVHCSHSWCCVK